MRLVILLAVVVFLSVGCNRNRMGGDEGYYEPEASERSTIRTGTSEEDARTAPPGSAKGPAGEASGGAYGTGLSQPGGFDTETTKQGSSTREGSSAPQK